ncbi:reverse transcriptase domain-containing protein [Tanacetum coccineum]
MMERRTVRIDNDQIEKFYEIFWDLSFEISFTDALMLMPKFASTLKTLIGNKENLPNADFSFHVNFPGLIHAMPWLILVQALILYHISSGKISLSELTSTCITLELADRSISEPIGIAEDVYVTVGKFQFSCRFLSVDFEPDPEYLILVRSFLKDKSSINRCSRADDFLLFEKMTDYFLALEDDQLHGRLATSFGICIFGGDDKLPVIIAKDLKNEEKAALIEVLKSHKRAIAWKLSDIKGINPEFCTHKILMEEDYEPTVQHQRRVNPKIHDVIKKEVEKLLDAGLIYPISDSPWVSPVHCVPKKGGMTVVKNDENDLIPTRLVTGWRVCIDYRKLNEATRKDHFPLPFMDQMLERLAGNQFYCFLDGFSGYFQIPIDPKDQEKTTFTCPYGTFAYRRMPFGLCNAQARSNDV